MLFNELLPDPFIARSTKEYPIWNPIVNETEPTHYNFTFKFFGSFTFNLKKKKKTLFLTGRIESEMNRVVSSSIIYLRDPIKPLRPLAKKSQEAASTSLKNRVNRSGWVNSDRLMQVFLKNCHVPIHKFSLHINQRRKHHPWFRLDKLH